MPNKICAFRSINIKKPEDLLIMISNFLLENCIIIYDFSMDESREEMFK